MRIGTHGEVRLAAHRMSDLRNYFRVEVSGVVANNKIETLK